MVGLAGFADSDNLESEATAVSGDGSAIVGWACNAQYATEAFIWDQDHGMRHLRDVLDNIPGLDLPGWQLGLPTAMSADGLTIVGNGTNPVGNEEAWIVRLPEPGTLLLVLLGCVFVPR